MKKQMLTFLAAASLTLGITNTALAQSTGPELVSSPYTEAYLPIGFDSNDHVQIAAEGVFRNTCYKPGPVSFEMADNNIYLTSQAYYYDGPCFKMLLPYHQVIDIGILPQGKYKIFRKSGGVFLGELDVAEATATVADDYLYAPISQAFITQQDGKNFLTIEGKFNNSCMLMKEVRIRIQPKVVVVQPIAEIAEAQGCTDGAFPFSETRELKGLEMSKFLLHVRSLNGSAINSLIVL